MKPIRILLLLLFSVTLFASQSVTAQAHTALELSNPSSNQLVEFMPAELSATFDEDLIEIEGEVVNTLELQSADGKIYALSSATISGPVVSAKVGDGEYPAGEYLLKYRVVSADGHPVTGEISFSTQSATTIGSTPAEPVTTAFIPEPVDSSSNTWLYPIGGAILLVGILFGVKRKRGSWQK
jgi:methionine-rich copper-binding protein CopC